MKFSVSRETLLRPLGLMVGVVGRRNTLPILSHIRLDATPEGLTITGLDLEVELIWRLHLDHLSSPGTITVPAKKLSDICKSLRDNAQIEFEVQGDKALVVSGASRFTLQTLPSSEFPSMQLSPVSHQVNLPQKVLRYLIHRNDFAMARDDIRYYLNGMYFELKTGQMRAVATDGHRLSLADAQVQTAEIETSSMIVPGKAVHDLAKLLEDSDDIIEFIFGEQHFQVNAGSYTFISKHIEGRYPDYERVIPREGNKTLVCPRLELRQILSRISILANEKFQGIRLLLEPGLLTLKASNSEHEEASETLALDYQGEALEIGFNVSYLIDVMDNIGDEIEQIEMILSDANSSGLIQAHGQPATALYVVMPMRL